MILTILSSESKGNCYLLESDSGTLIIEAGIRLSEVKKALNYDLSGVVGCLITHCHGDHFKYSKQFASSGINIYAQNKTIELVGVPHRCREIVPGELKSIGSFRVVGFSVAHNVPTLGYLIDHPEMGKMLFVTDSAYIKNRFSGLNQICIEANYDDPLLMNDRAIGKHMSIDTCLNFLQSNDLSHIRNIVLLHLSSQNSNSKEFISKVKHVSRSSRVHVADKSMKIQLNINPF